MLNAFLEEHAKDIKEKEASSLNLKDFRAFMYRIPGIARKSVQPVLGKREMVLNCMHVYMQALVRLWKSRVNTRQGAWCLFLRKIRVGVVFQCACVRRFYCR